MGFSETWVLKTEFETISSKMGFKKTVFNLFSKYGFWKPVSTSHEILVLKSVYFFLNAGTESPRKFMDFENRFFCKHGSFKTGY